MLDPEPDPIELRHALKGSLRLQSHYATLLNAYDRGERLTFTLESWIERLRLLEKP